MPGRPGAMDCVGVVLSTVRGPVAILCVYAPPGPGLEENESPTLLYRMRSPWCLPMSFRLLVGGESEVAVSLDIKGAFNSALPKVLSEQLRRLGLSSRILNFISHMTVSNPVQHLHDSVNRCPFFRGAIRHVC